MQAKTLILHVLLYLASFSASSAANAAPDNSCAGKFVGRWNWLSSNGIHTAHDFAADGSVPCSENGFCVRGASWRCSGDDLYYNNGMGETKLTLSADGTKMTGMGGFPSNLQTVTRLGPVPQVQARNPVATRGCNGGVTVMEEALRDDNCLIVNNQCGVPISVKLGTTQSAKYKGSQTVQGDRPARICSGWGSWKYIYKGYTVPKAYN